MIASIIVIFRKRFDFAARSLERRLEAQGFTVRRYERY